MIMSVGLPYNAEEPLTVWVQCASVFLTLGLCFRGGLALPVARPPCSPHTAYLVEQTLNAPGLTACRLRGGRCRKLGPKFERKLAESSVLASRVEAEVKASVAE